MHSQVSQLRRHPQFHSQFLAHDRDVLVWLPPGYPEVHDIGSERRFISGVHDGGSEQRFTTEVPDGRNLVMNPGDEPSNGTSALNRRYPVLYMHDGQNLFEPETA